MPRNDEINEEMRSRSVEKIIAASARHFAEKGFFASRMKDISDAAGMSVGNLYWYFKNKEEILKILLRKGFDEQQKVLAEAVNAEGSADDKLDILLESYIQLCRKNSDFFSISLNILANKGAPFFKELGFDTAVIGHGYHLLLMKLLQESKRRNYSDDEIMILPLFFFSLFSGLMLIYGDNWHQVSDQSLKEAAKRLIGWQPGGNLNV